MSRKNRSMQRQATRHCGSQTGFTLIELIVTIAIGTLLMLVAVPSFVQFQRNAQLSDAVSSFISAANTARANAMKQGLNTYLIPNSGTNWNSGWFVYADSDWDKVYDAGTDEVVLRHEALSADITISTPGSSTLSDPAGKYLLFNGSGYPKTKTGAFGAGTIEMSNTSPRKSSIIIDAAGRVRSCKTGATGCSVSSP